ncbi:hypothetical protein SEA_NIKLAS_37 [Mycobacterium Phage Niklas]|uniref:Helix-turn-helix DNA binding domain protein n=1 Tax=Mycobacterium Phage Niklas TaxID=2517936 RepID=A0A482JHE6_9CAUD|nr:HTH DNA binding protein [Mycobacterium Phage Niklas]ASR85921.1 hypothetical protein SEA_PEANAM_37 [Mycobacterium phage Peanam]QAY02768.1 hypothetical protein SEA_SHAOBING_37 [Mycobacterium phage Shaobing]QBP31619.1 hypothetical protein SEA_NIKLAS_37 [Mycobacterium Phage Niklas]
MSATTMTVRALSEQEAEKMARGLTVSAGGRRRTIPALNVPRYQNMVDQIEAEYPGPENEHRRRAAIEAAARYLCDDLDAEGMGDELAEAREVYEAATAAARMVVLLSIEDGASELSLANRMGINRLTVRKYRGKQDR